MDRDVFFLYVLFVYPTNLFTVHFNITSRWVIGYIFTSSRLIPLHLTYYCHLSVDDFPSNYLHQRVLAFHVS